MTARHRALAGVALAAIAVLGVLCFWPFTWLIVRHEGETRLAFPVDVGTQFALAWRHSVEAEHWIEVFAIRAHAIVLIRTRFKTFGAGVPARIASRTELRDGWVVMSGIERRVDPLRVQAASAQCYRLRMGGRWRALASPGSAPILRFAVIESPAIRLLWPAVRGWRGAPVMP